MEEGQALQGHLAPGVQHPAQVGGLVLARGVDELPDIPHRPRRQELLPPEEAQGWQEEAEDRTQLVRVQGLEDHLGRPVEGRGVCSAGGRGRDC